MSWRLVAISSPSKLSYKNGFLVVRNDRLTTIHLSEISVILLETTTYNITGMLLAELSHKNIPVIFCDDKKMPTALGVPIYGHHKSSYRLNKQIHWDSHRKNKAWMFIVKNKVRMQSDNIKDIDVSLYRHFLELSDFILEGDVNNIEAQVAKKYFRPFFGNHFRRDPKKDCNINQCLNYVYTILLSLTVRHIVSMGYCTQLGIFHHSRFNHFNLASDLMEPFRPLADQKVKELDDQKLTPENKQILATIVNNKVSIDGKQYYLSNGVGIFVRSVIDYLNYEREDILEIGGFG